MERPEMGFERGFIKFQSAVASLHHELPGLELHVGSGKVEEAFCFDRVRLFCRHHATVYEVNCLLLGIVVVCMCGQIQVNVCALASI